MRVDEYAGPGEFLTITAGKDPATVERHKDRYIRALHATGIPFGGFRGIWLDCACGTGYGAQLIRAFSGTPSRYIGVDRSRDAINEAISHNRYKWARFIRGDLTEVDSWLPALGQFDVILSLETLEHLAPGVQDLWVCEARQALNTDGVFIVACPIGNDGPSSYNRYHLHEPSLDGLNALLSRHFKSVEIETEGYVDTGGHEAVQAFAVCR